MFKSLLITLLLVTFTYQTATWANAIKGSQIKEVNSNDFSQRTKNSNGTIVFYGMEGCGRTSYWAPKIKSWVADHKSKKDTAGKYTYEWMGCKQGGNMNTCWNQGVRQLPGIGIYDSKGKQVKFYMNTSGMNKFLSDMAPKSGAPAKTQNTSANKPKKPNTGKVGDNQKNKPAPKSAQTPKGAFAKSVTDYAKGLVSALSKQNLEAFTSKSQSVILYGAGSDSNTVKYGSFWARFLNGQKLSGKDLSSTSFGVIDCDDFSESCFNEGISSFPTLVLYRNNKPIHSWPVNNWNEFFQTIQGKIPKSFPKVNPNRKEALKALLLKKAPKNMFWLNADNWMEQARTERFRDGDVHVFYGSAGCGLTRYYGPKWLDHIKERISNKIDPKTDYGVVDCIDDNSLCWKGGVRKYPHVAIWSKGKIVAGFDGQEGILQYFKEYPTNKSNSDSDKNLTDNSDKSGSADRQKFNGWYYFSSGNDQLGSKIGIIFQSRGKKMVHIDCDHTADKCTSNGITLKNLPALAEFTNGQKGQTAYGFTPIVGLLQGLRRRLLKSRKLFSEY